MALVGRKILDLHRAFRDNPPLYEAMLLQLNETLGQDARIYAGNLLLKSAKRVYSMR
ncbi:MAG: hypothetical protein PHH70_05170 [Candidatus Gracilibacteria bacterium]|nr:hypothetical protein [Candidatus Gracilibacteria bacterium]